MNLKTDYKKLFIWRTEIKMLKIKEQEPVGSCKKSLICGPLKPEEKKKNDRKE